MKNKLINISIILIFIFTSLISVEAAAPSPRVDLDEYSYTSTSITNINIQGIVNIGAGQNIALFDSTGTIPLNYTTVKNSNSKESFNLTIPARFLKGGLNTFKVISLPVRDVLNASSPKTVTVKVGSAKNDQVITCDDLELQVNEKSNIHAKVSSNLPLTYVSENPTIVTVDKNGTAFGHAVGTTSVIISQAGNNDYNPTIKKITVKVSPAVPGNSKTYTIIYNANYGEGKMAAQKIKGNSLTKLKANTFKRPYYTFAGWAQSKNGKVVYKNKAAIKTNRNLTLYAKWTASYKKPNGKVAEGQSPKAGIAYGKMKYSKGGQTRGIVCVIRAKDPGLANAIADNAEKITNNNKIGYSTSSGVGPKLYAQLVKYGPKKARGKASCSPFALCCLKYSMYKNPEYKFATSDKYGINCNWRSDSSTNIRTGMKSVKKKIEKSRKSCPYVLIYDTSKFKNWKTKLYRGDIAICKHHVFVIL